MELTDVQFGGAHVYYCQRSEQACHIVASHADDGACLIAERYSPNGQHDAPMFITEACYLLPENKNTPIQRIGRAMRPSHKVVRPRKVGKSPALAAPYEAENVPMFTFSECCGAKVDTSERVLICPRCRTKIVGLKYEY